MDSHVLLHSLQSLQQQLPARLSAIHVNHRLSPNAADWARRNRMVCAALGIELEIVEIDARNPPGASPEAWARRKRYAALAERIRPRQILLTAHHQDDQAETLLLQLFRGAGPAGLAAMPVTRPFSGGWHCRPLLGIPRLELRHYAERHGLQWLEDESNEYTGFDRNYIRHQLLPVITRHWPGVVATLFRSAQHQAEASELLEDIARLDLAAMHTGSVPDKLDISHLKNLPVSRQKNLIRHWCHMRQLPLPDAGQLQRIITDVLYSGPDASPCVTWAGVELRRYRQYLYAAPPGSRHDPDRVLLWHLTQPLDITQGRLQARLEQGGGIKASLCPGQTVEVRYRSGGESIMPAGRAYHHELRKLLQEQGVPPWLRDRIPLVYIDGRLAAVPGKWIAQEFLGTAADQCWRIVWEGSAEIFPV
jgi:tRNA(Ile)-lysidine synthase